MSGPGPSPPAGDPPLQTVLTLTAGKSPEKSRGFRWGTRVEPIAIGAQGAWRVQAPGVLDVHLYVAFDGRQVQVAAAQGASVTVHGAELGHIWRAVPVRTELRFGGATIAITCEEAPRTGPQVERAGSSPPGATSPSVPDAQQGALGPRTLMVTTPEAVKEMLDAVGPMEPALPRTGTLRLMERAWAPPTPAPLATPSEPPAAAPAVPRGQPIGRHTPRAPIIAPPAGFVPQAPVPRTPIPQAPIPQAPIPAPRDAPFNVQITQPPTVFNPQAPSSPPREVPPNEQITQPPTAFNPQAPGSPPRAAVPPPTPTTQPSMAVRPQSPISPPGPAVIAPVARVTPPPPDDPAPPAAPAPTSFAESAPNTMADGGALREHAKRLESLPPEAADPATLQYLSAVRVYSGKSPSEPPPASPPAFAGEVATPRTEAKKSPTEAPTGAAPTPAVQPPKVAEKPKGGSSWKETSKVKKAILFLLPFAGAATIFEMNFEPEEAPAPAPRKTALSSASALAPAGQAPVPAANGLGSPAPSAQAAASPSALPNAIDTVASPSSIPLSTAQQAPAAAASGGPVVAIAAIPSGAASPAVAGSAASPAVAGSTASPVVAGSAASPVVAGSATPPADSPSDGYLTAMQHLALTAAFEGNLKLAASLYSKLAAANPDSQVFALAARFVKEGAVRTP